MPVESHRDDRGDGPGRIEIRLLGPLAIDRDGVPIALPASRKVRALLAYLTLAPRPVARAQLCELLWDVPDDPRGELRWCLSKIRGLLDAPDRRRVLSADDAVGLDLAGCRVDALAVAAAVQARLAEADPDHLAELAGRCAGDFLEGLELERCPAFAAWLAAQRRRFRGCHAAILEEQVRRAPDGGRPALEKWLELAPFDRRVHERLLQALARDDRIRDGEEHLAVATRMFEAEGLDAAPLRRAWLAARAPGPPAVAAEPAPDHPAPRPRRAAIAVMPFEEFGDATGVRGGAADGLVDDIITRLAKLRVLLVIARGTTFALRERNMPPEEAGRLLDVDYVVSGSLRRNGRRLGVSVELAEARSARIVWAEVFNPGPGDTFALLDQIGDRIVASVASEIETIERNRAILRPPNSLDAWEAYHRGLWHMYRFDRAENAEAQRCFAAAVRLDPTFARAHAGLSFTHWQNAFQGWAPRAGETDRAFAAAGQALMADDRDPAAHLAMGRALWLRRRNDQSVAELERAIELSPNFAMGHYALAFVQSQDGDPLAAIAASDHSRQLSPCDPLLFGMLGARAMALIRLGRFEEAADYAGKAAERPNAHTHILAIAAFAAALSGRVDEARRMAADIRRARPGYGVADFLSAFHFADDGAALIREAARRIGLD
ncbi:hypothetical protein [Stella sp.]|uniref:hypothetical protein n=1 Tax=Stella sp. TaxID=2912054 RepID=UPI0035B42A41